MDLNISGFPSLVLEIVFIILFTVPIWIGAKFVGAERATFLNSALALIIGVAAFFFAGAIGGAVVGGWAFILAPLAMLLAFKYVLKTSFFGSVILAIVAAAGYFLLGHLISSGISITSHNANT